MTLNAAGDKVIRTIYDADGKNLESSGTIKISKDLIDVELYEPSVKGGVKFGKVNGETGNPVSGAEITIYSAVTNEEVTTITTGTDGIATTAEDELFYGSYYAKETKAPEGYVLNSEWRSEFVISADRVIVDMTEDALENPPVRGDIVVPKIDAELDKSVPQGSATLAGAEITIYSAENNEYYKKDEVVMTITTNENGIAKTTENALLYGKYYAKETKAPVGYLLNTEWNKSFNIVKNGESVDARPEHP